MHFLNISKQRDSFTHAHDHYAISYVLIHFNLVENVVTSTKEFPKQIGSM